MQSTLHMPLQSAPINRGSAPASLTGPGIEASQTPPWLQTVGQVAGTVLPILASLF